MIRVDLAGRIFGELKVLKRHGVDKYGQSEWLCECKCGNKTIVRMNNLVRGHTTSCGCKKYERFGKDITNERFGRLRVLEFHHMGPRGRSYYLCECECGKQIIARRDQLISGHTRSCGCYAIDMTIERSTRHGLCKEPLYNIWRGMKHRCADNECIRYGGRGIKVCEEWGDFEVFYNWAMDNGYEPGLTIDRIDNDGDYCPENCRWADYVTQANNKHTNRVIEYEGVSHTISEWSRIFGVHRESLNYRINHNNMRDFENYFNDKRNT